MSLKWEDCQLNATIICRFVDSLVAVVAAITGGPCKEFTYVLAQFSLHWGEEDSAGSEHLINSTAYPAEVSLYQC